MAVGLLGLVALGVRLLYIHQSQVSPFFDFPLVDAKTYTDAARQMAVEGNWGGDDFPFWQPPLYPYFLGLVFEVLGDGYYLPRLIQAALGALNCILIYSLGRRIFSLGLGFAAGILAALYGPFIFFDAEFLPSALALCLDLLALLALLWAASGDSRRFLVPGLLLGTAALCVASVLLFWPFAVLWAYIHDSGPSLRRRFVPGLLLSLGVLLAIAPVSLRNYLVSGERVPISTNAGINFYIGNNPEYEQTVRIQPGRAWRELVNRPRNEAGITRRSEQSSYFFGKAWEFIRAQPGAYLRLLLYKTYLFWHGDEIGRNQDLYFARNYSSLLSLLLWKGWIAFPFGILAPLALWGIGVALRQGLHRRPEIALLLLFLCAYGLAVVLFFVASRYRLPVIPVLLLFAAYGVRESRTLLRGGTIFGLGGALAALVALFAVSNFRVGAMHMDGDADAHHRLGFVFQQKGLQANAIAEYERALAMDPDIQEARFNLGSLHAQRGRYDQAIAAYRELVARFPEQPEARLALGNAFLHARRYGDAIAQYEWLLAAGADGDRAGVQGLMAYAHLQLGELDEAARIYRGLLASRPDSLLVRAQLGQLYEAREMFTEAEGEYREVLRRDPDQDEVRFRLAYVLFVVDRPEEAKSHLQRLIARDPEDVQARWLLAAQYVVEHRGREALEQAETILRIQPGHVQANRLAGHLHVIEGDTLKGVEKLERFKKYYVEERQEEILEVLKGKWGGQIRDMFNQ